MTAADNTAPTVTSQTLSNLELGSETGILDWGFSDLDLHALGRIEFTGGDRSWIVGNGAFKDYHVDTGNTNKYVDAGNLSLLKVVTPYSGGSQQFTYIAYDEFGAASTEATFTLTAETPVAIGALDGNEATARIGGYSNFNISGNLLDLVDVSRPGNVANGIDVSQYEGGILNITPVPTYSKSVTVQLGVDVAQIPVGEWPSGYVQLMRQSQPVFPQ